MPSSEKSGRTAALTAATLVAVGMIAQQVAAKATRDAFFLSEFPATALPAVMIAGAGVSLIVVLLMSRAVTRWSPARVVPFVFAASGALFLAEWALAERMPRPAAAMVYIHVAALGAAVVSGFWSVVNERFDPHTAKRMMGRIAAGATLGGVIGGVAAWQGSKVMSLPAMLAALAVLNLVCAAGATRIGSLDGAQQRTDGPAPSGVQVLRQVPYLRHLAALVLIGTLGEAVIDYVFKVAASDAYTTSESLITFFALFHMGAGVLTFAVQTVFVKRSLQGLGLAGTVALLPVAVLAGSTVALFIPVLWSFAALRGGRAVVESSLYRSAYELLYTPLTPDKKRPTKTLIDVACDRLGTAAGSGIALAVIALVPAFADSVLLGIAIGAAILSILLAGLLNRGYVQALADSLRSGAVKLDDAAVVDATTRRTMSDTTMALDRDKLLREIEALRERRAASGDAPAPAAPVEMVHEQAVVGDDPVLAAVGELRSNDRGRIRAALRRRPFHRELVSHAVPLLARDDVLGDAVAALRSAVNSCVGQLLDALLDPSSDFAVRRRLPRVLVSAPNQRTVDGLVRGLSDVRFEVRYRCGVALLRIRTAGAQTRVPRDAIVDAAKREAAQGGKNWNAQQLLDSVADDADLPFCGEARAIGKGLEHVFNILALVLDPEPLQLAFRALAAEDDGLRGTGLEYLENVLPPDIREPLWPYLGDRRVAKKVSRPQRVVLDDLLTSMDSTGIDVEALRKAIASSDS